MFREFLEKAGFLTKMTDPIIKSTNGNASLRIPFPVTKSACAAFLDERYPWLIRLFFFAIVSFYPNFKYYFGISRYLGAIRIIANASPRQYQEPVESGHFKLSLLPQKNQNLWNGGVFIAYYQAE